MAISQIDRIRLDNWEDSRHLMSGGKWNVRANSRIELLLEAMRCPPEMAPQKCGEWEIVRNEFPGNAAAEFSIGGWDNMTSLRRPGNPIPHHRAIKGGHLCGEHPEVVMEDSRQELCTHLPILLRARGRVLVTGLGLGCVVRGLLAIPEVEHIDVIEKDPNILAMVGPFIWPLATIAVPPAARAGQTRVSFHCDDALSYKLEGPWNWAWHDLCEEPGNPKHLQFFHARALFHWRDQVGQQGAWRLPRWVRRLCRKELRLF